MMHPLPPQRGPYPLRTLKAARKGPVLGKWGSPDREVGVGMGTGEVRFVGTVMAGAELGEKAWSGGSEYCGGARGEGRSLGSQ